MLVDNPLHQQSSFYSPPTTSAGVGGATAGGYSTDFSTDLNDIFHSDLFASSSSSLLSSASNPSPPSTSSRASSPSSPYHALLTTPPQGALPVSFPDVHEAGSNPFFSSMFDEEMKVLDPLATNPYDFLSATGAGYAGMDFSNMGLGMGGMDFMSGLGGMDFGAQQAQAMQAPPPEDAVGIDPALVGTPAMTEDNDSSLSSPEDEDSPQMEEPTKRSSSKAKSPVDDKSQQQEKLTLTIAPVKVGGHGKARKGTVQSGGVVKKVSASTTPISLSVQGPTSQNKENAALLSSSSASASTSTTTTKKPTTKKAPAAAAVDDDDDDDDDLPHDWRPSPEVFAKMTSKEKRQLRNKISARNFRVRRKEYISTLEGDIAERDRLLSTIRSELGSTQSENLALRQEISALKKTLLEGRGAGVSLPPPAPLPETSAAEVVRAREAAAASKAAGLMAPNTQKDLPTSPRLGSVASAFWGGRIGGGIGGGITPVHTTLVPELMLGRRELQENINPALNANTNVNAQVNLGSAGQQGQGKVGFDGFADLNPFTMKTLDAYRMHLWGKMAAQHHAHQHQQQQQPPHQQSRSPSPPASSLAQNLRPLFFSQSAKPNLPTPSSGPYGNTLSALLSGKHTSASPSAASAYPSPPSSPNLSGKSSQAQQARDQQQREAREQQQAALLAAMASQTLFRKLGSAFWDAFSGSSSSSKETNSKNWDADKVRKVLEGKAVVRVVDVEAEQQPVTRPVGIQQQPLLRTPPTSPLVRPQSGSARESGPGERERCSGSMIVCDILEESMRSLTLGKKM